MIVSGIRDSIPGPVKLKSDTVSLKDNVSSKFEAVLMLLPGCSAAKMGLATR